MARAALALALLTLAPVAAAQGQPPRYQLTDLGTLGGSESEALGLNDAGQVVGWSLTADGNTRAFLYDGGTMSDLGTLGGPDSEAHGINNQGQIVGWADVDHDLAHAFLYEQGQMRDLAPGSKDGSWLEAINDAGGAVGGAARGDVAEVPYRWDGREFAPLAGLEKGVGDCVDINEAGQIVGAVRPAEGVLHVFLWDGAVQHLPELGQYECWASGINGAGEIVGQRARGPGDAETSPIDVYLWAQGKVRDLTAETKQGDWSANDLNDAGQIVGSAGGGTRAILYANGQLHQLSDLLDGAPKGFRPIMAKAINATGMIAGSARTHDGKTHAFLAKPLAASPPPANAPVSQAPSPARAISGASAPGSPTVPAPTAAVRFPLALVLGVVAVLVVLVFVLVLALGVVRRNRQGG